MHDIGFKTFLVLLVDESLMEDFPIRVLESYQKKIIPEPKIHAYHVLDEAEFVRTG